MGLESLQGFIASALDVCAAQFPRTCNTCKRNFDRFADFVEATTRIGAPKMDLDEDEDDEPLGLLVFANCSCGTTLAICYEDVTRHREFNRTVRASASSSAARDVLLGGFVDNVNERAHARISQQVGLADREADLPEPQVLQAGAAMIDYVRQGLIELPPCPSVALALQELAQAPNSTIDQMARAVSADAALASLLILRANSAAERRGGAAITTLKGAISRLGIQEVVRQAFAAQMTGTTSQPGPLAALRHQLWRHSVVRAVIARALAKRRGLSADEAFMCGLLHTLGDLVGAMNLERFFAGEQSFPPQRPGWWLRVISYFQTELTQLLVKDWELVPLFAEVLLLRAGEELTASPNAALLEVVRTAHSAARSFMDKRCVLAADLEQLGDDADTVVEAVIEQAAQVAELSGGMQTQTSKRCGIIGDSLEVVALPDPIALDVEAGGRVELTHIGQKAGVVERIEGKPLPERELTMLSGVQEPKAGLWVSPRELTGARHAIEPFALSVQAEACWRRWCAAAGV